MGEYFFSVGNGTDKKTATKRDRIARKVGGHGCGYVNCRLPEGPRSWGYAPNRGAPFDAATAREIQAAWEAAGVGSSAPAPRN